MRLLLSVEIVCDSYVYIQIDTVMCIRVKESKYNFQLYCMVGTYMSVVIFHKMLQIMHTYFYVYIGCNLLTNMSNKLVIYICGSLSPNVSNTECICGSLSANMCQMSRMHISHCICVCVIK